MIPAVQEWQQNNTRKEISGHLELATHCSNLTVIYLFDCDITDDGIIELAIRCPKLTTVELGWCKITHKAISALQTHCPNLKKIR